MAIGAFTSALLVARSGWPLEPAALAGAAALVAGVLCGGVVRLRRAFVAVSTWLLAWLVWLFLLAFPSVSGGSQGLILPQRTLLGLDATPTVHFEVALALTRPDGAGGRGRAARARRGSSSRRCGRLRRSRPRSASGSRGAGSGAFSATAAIAGLAGGLSVQLQAVADPAATTRSSRSSCWSRCCSAARRRRSARRPASLLLGLIGLASGPLARALQLPLERFDAAVAALLLVFVLALGGQGIVPWALRRLRRERRPPRAPAGDAARGSARPSEPVLRARRPAQGLRRRRRRRRALARARARRDDGADRAERLGQDDRAAPDLGRRAAPTRARSRSTARDVTAAPTSDRVRLGIARTLQTTAAFRGADRARGRARRPGRPAPPRRPRSAPRSRRPARAREQRPPRPRLSRRWRSSGSSAGRRRADARADELSAAPRRARRGAGDRAATSCSWTSSPRAPARTSSTASRTRRPDPRARRRGAGRRAQPAARPPRRRPRDRARRRDRRRRGLGRRGRRERGRPAGVPRTRSVCSLSAVRRLAFLLAGLALLAAGCGQERSSERAGQLVIAVDVPVTAARTSRRRSARASSSRPRT